MSDDEVVDPKVAIEEKCTNGSTCGKLLVEYERCAKRIENKPGGECSGQYMDFVACVDNCVSRRAAHDAGVVGMRAFCEGPRVPCARCCCAAITLTPAPHTDRAHHPSACRQAKNQLMASLK